jgi:hypothetical protein
MHRAKSPLGVEAGSIQLLAPVLKTGSRHRELSSAPKLHQFVFSTDLTAARFFGNVLEDFACGHHPQAGTGPLHLVVGPVSFTRAEFRLSFAQSQDAQYHERPFRLVIYTAFPTGFPQGLRN